MKPTDDQRRTKRQALLAVLKDLRWHGGEELERVGGNRYSARIDELRARGYEIVRRVTDSGRFDEYLLVSKTPGAPRTQAVRIDLSEWELNQLMIHKVTPDSLKEKISKAWDRLHEKKAKREKLVEELPAVDTPDELLDILDYFGDD